MKKVRITVVKCAWHQDLADQYANPGLGPCRYNREGMQFICENGWQKPEGLCDNAWKSLAHGGGNFYDGEMRDPNAFIASCNDGFRPVSFLIETMGDENE